MIDDILCMSVRSAAARMLKISLLFVRTAKKYVFKKKLNFVCFVVKISFAVVCFQWI